MVSKYFIKTNDTYIQIDGVRHSYSDNSIVFISKTGEVVLTIRYDKLDFFIDLNECNESKLLLDSNIIQLEY